MDNSYSFLFDGDVIMNTFIRLIIGLLIAPQIALASSLFRVPTEPGRSIFAMHTHYGSSGTLSYERDTRELFNMQRAFLNDARWMGKTFRNTINNGPSDDKAFLFGVSSSHYQIEGGYDELVFKNPFSGKIDPSDASERFYQYMGYDRPGKAINFWNNYKEIIPQMKKELGINSFRLSIGWSRVIPTAEIRNDKESGSSYLQPIIDHKALDHYADIVKTLRDNNIEPIVVFHHYTIPSWFEDIGGFACEENIDYFVEFCALVYAALHEHVTYWSTYNAIEGYAFKGYYKGEGSPGIKGDLHTTQVVMKNMLEAHVRIYQEIKKSYRRFVQINDTITEPLIGIQKNIIPMDIAQHSLWWTLSFLSKEMASIATIIQNKGFYQFFTEGKFEICVSIPFKGSKGSVNISHINEDAPYCLDWIGVNHYSNMYMGPLTKALEPDKSRLTRNKNYRYYPEGLYRAIDEISKNIAIPVGKLKNKNKNPIPIIISENGIAATSGEMRKRFFQETLYTIMNAIHDGYNVIGYLPWSSHDNYEWGTKKGTKRYGFFAVDFNDENNPLITGLKPSSLYYRDVLNTFFSA